MIECLWFVGRSSVIDDLYDGSTDLFRWVWTNLFGFENVESGSYSTSSIAGLGEGHGGAVLREWIEIVWL